MVEVISLAVGMAIGFCLLPFSRFLLWRYRRSRFQSSMPRWDGSELGEEEEDGWDPARMFPLPPMPEEGDLVLTFLLPLPHPLPLDDGRVLTLYEREVEGGAPPILLRVWQLVDSGLQYLLMQAAMAQAALRSANDETVHTDERDFLAQAPHFDGIRSVVEAVVTTVRKPGSDPNEVLGTALGRCVDAIAEMSRSMRASGRPPVEVVAIPKLPPFIMVSANSPNEEPVYHLWHVPDSPPPVPKPTSLSEMELEEAALRFRLHMEGFQANTYGEAFHEAGLAHYVRGDNAAAVIWAHVAVEVLLDSVLQMMLWEEGVRPREALVLFAKGLRERVRSSFQSRLGGDWNLVKGPMAEWGGNGGLAELRGRVVHRGYRPTREEATRALETIENIQKFLMGRVRMKRTRYPRTTMLSVGRATLEREGLFTGEFARKIDEIADVEPLWTREVAEFGESIARLRSVDGGLTGREWAVMKLDDGQPRWWIWDPDDGAFSPGLAPRSDLLDSLVGEAIRWLGRDTPPLPLSGLAAGAEAPDFRLPTDYELAPLDISVTLNDLTTRLLARFEVVGMIPEMVEASLCVTIAEALLEQGRFPQVGQILRRALTSISSATDPLCAGDVAVAIGFCARRNPDARVIAREAFDMAVSMYRDAGDGVRQGAALLESASESSISKDYGRAESELRQALALFKDDQHMLNQAKATGNLGLALLDLGKHAEATEMQERATSIFLTIGDWEGAAKSAGAFGRTLAQAGDISEASYQYQEAVRLLFQAHDVSSAVDPALGMAAMAVRDGLRDAATTILLRIDKTIGAVDALGVGAKFVDFSLHKDWPWDPLVNVEEAILETANALEEKGSVSIAGLILGRLSELAAEESRLPMALELARRAVELGDASESASIQLRLLSLADVFSEAGDHAGALAISDRRFEIAVEVGDQSIATIAALGAAIECIRLEMPEHAEQWLDQLNRMDLEAPHKGWACGLRGLAAEQVGDLERATALWSQALSDLQDYPELRDQVVDWMSDVDS